jgi:hypothetical protein
MITEDTNTYMLRIVKKDPMMRGWMGDSYTLCSLQESLRNSDPYYISRSFPSVPKTGQNPLLMLVKMRKALFLLFPGHLS